MEALAKLRAKIRPRNCRYSAVSQVGSFSLTTPLRFARQYLGENKRRVGFVLSGITYGSEYGIKFAPPEKSGALTLSEGNAAIKDCMNNSGFANNFGGLIVRPATVFRVCPTNTVSVVLNTAGAYGNERTIFQGVRQ